MFGVPYNYTQNFYNDNLQQVETPPKSVSLDLQIRGTDGKTVEMDEIDDFTSVKDLKKQYLEELGKKKSKKYTYKNVRLLYRGPELKDDMKLFTYEIDDGIVIQAVIRKW